MPSHFDPASTSDSATSEPARPFTVLLVDDDPDCRSLVRELIDEQCPACRVIEHENGKEAVTFLFECDSVNRPDVIFLDMEMPRMGGLEALEMIKCHPRLKAIPVIILSSVSDAQMIERAALLGANSYTIKHACVDEFIANIRSTANYWLAVHRYPRCKSAAAASGAKESRSYKA